MRRADQFGMRDKETVMISFHCITYFNDLGDYIR